MIVCLNCKKQMVNYINYQRYVDCDRWRCEHCNQQHDSRQNLFSNTTKTYAIVDSLEELNNKNYYIDENGSIIYKLFD